MQKYQRTLLLIALALLMIVSMAAAAAAAEKTDTSTAKTEPLKKIFNDVAATDNNALFINYLADLQIISGYPDGSFKAKEGLTRAQAAVILVKAAELDTPAADKSSFKDVAINHWAGASIAAAVKAGYIKGYPDGAYHPEEKLTRAQGISLVMRLSKQKDRDELPELKDMGKTHWAATDMATALNTGMIGLSQDKSLVYPEAEMSRGSLARALGTLLTKDPGLYIKTLAGTITDVKGEIKLTRNGSTSTLANNASVYKGDIISAGANSTASIMYPDGSSVLIKENTEIQIKESQGRVCIKKDGTGGIAVDNVDIELKKGTIFGALATKQESAQEKQQAGETLLASMDGLNYIAEAAKTPPWYQQAEAKKVKMKVDMPYGVAAVRGTYILVSVNQDGSCNVSCLTGDAEVGSKTGASVPLASGKSSGVSQAGTIAPPAPMAEQEKQQFSAVQQWVVNTALQIDQNKEATTPPVVEMVVEIPDQPVPPAQQAEQVKNTIDVVINALEASGIQLSEQVKNDLKQQLEKIQQDLSKEAEQVLNDHNTPPSNTPSGSEEPSVSYVNYASAGTYGPENAANAQTVAKNVIISAPGVILRNMIISKDLTLGAGIGEDSVILENVKVQGNTTILGGGATIILSGDFATVNVNASGAEIQVEGSIEELNISSTASGTIITGSGQILNAIINADGVEMEQAPLNWSTAAGVNFTVAGQSRTGSSAGNARLFSLSLSGGILSPAFSPDHFSYSASVGNSVYEVTIAAIPQERTAAVEVNGVSKADNTHILNLNVGANPINIVVTSLDGTTLEYKLIITRTYSGSKAITAFNFAGLNPVVTGCIDETAKTIALTVPYGTDITTLVPSITHTGTSITSNSGTAPDFSLTVGYTVTAADGSAQQYIVTVTVSAPSSSKIITATTIGTLVNGYIEAVAVPSGTKVSTLKAALTVSAHATAEILAASGGAAVADQSNTNVTTAMVIQVTAQDGSKAEYGVTFDQVINCLEDLNAIRNNLSGQYILARDLDFNDVGSYVYAGNQLAWTTGAGWTPVCGGTGFTGTFDGNGHAISNLYINSSNGSLGLFADIYGTVRNLGLLKVSINTTGINVGAISGFVHSGSVLNSYSTGNISAGGQAGGIVGYGVSGNIKGCSSSTNVSVGWAAGGICGRCESYPVIEDCFTTGNVSGVQVGGIAGWVQSASISRSYATGNISSGDQAGGLVGMMEVGSLQNSYALNSSVEISTGTKTTIGRVTSSGNTSACYANSAMTITPASHSGVDGDHISLANAMQKSTYSSNGWDIDNTGSNTNTIWIINEGNSFPVLRLIGEIPGSSNSYSEEKILCNWNTDSAATGPSIPTTFTITLPYALTYIDSYHQNGAPQSGELGLLHQDGTVYGPWPAVQTGDNKVMVVNKRVSGQMEDHSNTPLQNVLASSQYPVLKPGTYTVSNSDPGSWSYNTGSSNMGFAMIKGYKVIP